MAKNRKTYPSHLTLRLSPEEWAILERDAAGIPYSIHTRRCIRNWSNQAADVPVSKPLSIEDELRLALARLGKAPQTQVFDGMEKAARDGSLRLTDEQYQVIAAGGADTRLIKNAILKFLKYRMIYE